MFNLYCHNLAEKKDLATGKSVGDTSHEVQGVCSGRNYMRYAEAFSEVNDSFSQRVARESIPAHPVQHQQCLDTFVRLLEIEKSKEADMLANINYRTKPDNPINRDDIVASLHEIDGQDSNAALSGFSKD